MLELKKPLNKKDINISINSDFPQSRTLFKL